MRLKYQYKYQYLAYKYKYKYQYPKFVLKYRSSISTQYNKTDFNPQTDPECHSAQRHRQTDAQMAVLCQ